MDCMNKLKNNKVCRHLFHKPLWNIGSGSALCWGLLPLPHEIHRQGGGLFVAAMPRLPHPQEYLEFRKERSQMLLSRRNQMLLEFSFWNEPQPRAGPNIYELRTYKLKVPPPNQIPACLPPSLLWWCFTDTPTWVGPVPQHPDWGFWPLPPCGFRIEVCTHVCTHAHPGASQDP